MKIILIKLGIHVIAVIVIASFCGIQQCRITKLKTELGRQVSIIDKKSIEQAKLENELKYYKNKKKIENATKKAEGIYEKGDIDNIHRPYLDYLLSN